MAKNRIEEHLAKLSANAEELEKVEGTRIGPFTVVPGLTCKCGCNHPRFGLFNLGFGIFVGNPELADELIAALKEVREKTWGPT